MKTIRGLMPIVALGVVLTAALGAAGCGGSGQQVGSPVATATPVLELDVPLEVANRLQEIRDGILARAAELGEDVDAGDLDVADIARREWPTAALGCPDPNRSYAQVVTGGYALQVDAGETTYKVHVGDDGNLVVCEPSGQARALSVGPDTTPAAAPDRADPVRAVVTQDLASRLDVAQDELGVVEFQAVEWRDSSLGCPRPGRMYAQVITPGYRVVVKGPEETYEYHTDRSGNQVVLCQRPAGERRRLGSTEARQVAERARQALATRLDVDSSAISVTEVVPLALLSEPAPCPGADIPTGDRPAYQLRLEVDRQTYVYRLRGDQLLLCSQ